MNDFETKEYLEKLKQLRLSDSSRARIQNNLLEYARFHGVRAEEDSRLIMQVPQRTSLLRLFKQPKSMTAALIAIALIAGGGTSYAAGGAVPGDLLYPVKTEVNETIKSAFAFSNESEAKLQAKLAEERLQEAETLAAEGALTAEASATLGAQIKSHYDEAMARSAAAEADGNYEASASVRASLEGSFRTYATILTGLSANVSGNSSNALITEIRTYADGAASTQAQATTSMETSVDAKTTAEATVMAAEQLIAEIQMELTEAKTRVSADAHARAEAKLAEATVAQAEAQASLEAEAYTAAYASAQTALRIAHEVESMIGSMLRLDFDLDLDTNTEINIGSDRNEDDTTPSENPTEDNEDTIDLNINADTDATVDTDVIDVDVTGDTSLNSGLGL